MDKKNLSKNLVDAATIVLLAAAFAIAYVMGFVLIRDEYTRERFLTPVVLSLISVGGLGILYCSGCVTELVSRIKRDNMPIGFIVLFSLCTVCFISLVGVMLALLCGVASIESFLPRFVYIVSAVLIIGGYLESVIYANRLEAVEPTEAAEEAVEEAAETVEDGENK